MFDQGSLIEIKPTDTVLSVWHHKKGMVMKEVAPKYYRVVIESAEVGFKELVLHENEMIDYDREETYERR